MFVLFLASLGCAKALAMSGRSAADEPSLTRSLSSPWWSRLVTMPPKTRAFALAFAVNNIAATSSAFMVLVRTNFPI
ncbi:hypothetical protein KFE25_008685 [Diacronema lutheri]|uniref:Uncharacterized protein n=1 Tax=Diacronema lutheri TaxID=2081491 RepID=A0A8J5XTJ4_DIALT|nr:hypothetical protein KFE25_008685 [Diacronema lutheri]